VSGSIFAWRWSFQMQAVNMRDQFRFRGPSTEVEAQHLIRPLGRGAADPQADQQTRNEGGIDLDTHPIDPLAQQMPAAQHTFDPAEKQLDVIVTTHKTIDLVFHTQVYKLKRDMTRKNSASASSIAFMQNDVMEVNDETPAHSPATDCGRPAPVGAPPQGAHDHSGTPGEQ